MAEVKIAADSGGGSVGLAGPSTTTSNAAVQFKLPVADGSAGQVLKTDGSGNLSWVTPATTNGITHLDTWLLTANKNWSGTNTFDADWSRSTLFGNIGDAITKSGAEYSFPATGIWELDYRAVVYDSTENAYSSLWISTTSDDGSNWVNLVESLDAIPDDGSEDTYANPFCHMTFDVTNTSNCRIKLLVSNQQGAVIKGSSSAMYTGIVFKRIGDT